MGIDLKAGGRNTTNHRTELKSKNPYLALLVKLYSFLSRRTNARFNKVVLKRLYTTRINRPPVSLSRIARYGGKADESKIIVAVASVTNDIRLLNVPKVQVAALHFTETARARIEKAGGVCLTLDQLALKRPTGANTILVRGPKNAREAVKHFGAPGVPGSHAKPYIRAKGRKFEKARGRRSSRGFRV